MKQQSQILHNNLCHEVKCFCRLTIIKITRKRKRIEYTKMCSVNCIETIVISSMIQGGLAALCTIIISKCLSSFQHTLLMWRTVNRESQSQTSPGISP